MSTEAERFFDAAFAIARQLAPPRPRPKRQPTQIAPTFIDGVCDRCGVQVERDGRTYNSVVGVINGDPRLCGSSLWWRGQRPGTLPRHPVTAVEPMPAADLDYDECQGCLCSTTRMPPCSHCENGCGDEERAS